MHWRGSCFSGSLQQAERFVQLGYKIGEAGLLPIHAPVKPAMSSQNYAGIVVAGNRRTRYAAQWFSGQANRPEQAARVFDVLCELRRNRRMRLRKRCLITPIRCLTAVGRTRRLRRIRQLAHNA